LKPDFERATLVESWRKRRSARERLKEAWQRWARPWKFRRGVPDLVAKKLAEWKERRPHQRSHKEKERKKKSRNKNKLKKKDIYRTIRSYNGVSLLL
jgi:hypothetical protein